MSWFTAIPAAIAGGAWRAGKAVGKEIVWPHKPTGFFGFAQSPFRAIHSRIPLPGRLNSPVGRMMTGAVAGGIYGGATSDSNNPDSIFRDVLAGALVGTGIGAATNLPFTRMGRAALRGLSPIKPKMVTGPGGVPTAMTWKQAGAEAKREYARRMADIPNPTITDQLGATVGAYAGKYSPYRLGFTGRAVGAVAVGVPKLALQGIAAYPNLVGGGLVIGGAAYGMSRAMDPSETEYTQRHPGARVTQEIVNSEMMQENLSRQQFQNSATGVVGGLHTRRHGR